MRFSSRSCSSLRVLRLYLKVAIFQPELQEHAPRTTFVLKSCDFQAGAAADQGGIEPGAEGLRKQARTPRDNSAEGSSGSRQMRTAPQRNRSDTHDPRRGFIGLKTNSHGATARALRHAGSPQRVRQGQDKFARRHSESASTRTISAEGSSGSRQIRTAPQRERFDTQDLRRGFAKVKTNSHGATARALRHARSPQRVRQGQDKFARRHSESASTRTISAEGSPRSRQIRTAPQRERFDTHDLRRGFAKVKTNSEFARRHSESASTRTISAEGSPRSRQIRNSHGATARALRHARSPQRGAFRKLPSGLPPP